MFTETIWLLHSDSTQAVKILSRIISLCRELNVTINTEKNTIGVCWKPKVKHALIVVVNLYLNAYFFSYKRMLGIQPRLTRTTLKHIRAGITSSFVSKRTTGRSITAKPVSRGRRITSRCGTFYYHFATIKCT